MKKAGSIRKVGLSSLAIIVLGTMMALADFISSKVVAEESSTSANVGVEVSTACSFSSSDHSFAVPMSAGSYNDNTVLGLLQLQARAHIIKLMATLVTLCAPKAGAYLLLEKSPILLKTIYTIIKTLAISPFMVAIAMTATAVQVAEARLLAYGGHPRQPTTAIELICFDGWIEETISGTKNYTKRELGKLLKKVQKEDIIICSELSRLGRNLFMIMEILNLCMNKECRVYSV